MVRALCGNSSIYNVEISLHLGKFLLLLNKLGPKQMEEVGVGGEGDEGRGREWLKFYCTLIFTVAEKNVSVIPLEVGTRVHPIR